MTMYLFRNVMILKTNTNRIKQTYTQCLISIKVDIIQVISILMNYEMVTNSTERTFRIELDWNNYRTTTINKVSSYIIR